MPWTGLPQRGPPVPSGASWQSRAQDSVSSGIGDVREVLRSFADVTSGTAKQEVVVGGETSPEEAERAHVHVPHDRLCDGETRLPSVGIADKGDSSTDRGTFCKRVMACSYNGTRSGVAPLRSSDSLSCSHCSRDTSPWPSRLASPAASATSSSGCLRPQRLRTARRAARSRVSAIALRSDTCPADLLNRRRDRTLVGRHRLAIRFGSTPNPSR
jgi:hypothetical protein